MLPKKLPLWLVLALAALAALTGDGHPSLHVAATAFSPGDGPPHSGSAFPEAPGPPANGQDVVIFLREPSALRAVPLDRAALRPQVIDVQERVLSALPPSDFQVRYRYEALPALAGTISSRGLAALAAHPDVAAIWPDFHGQGALGQSVPLIKADDVHALRFTGAGTIVAVVDSGLDTDHPDLADDLVHQECFMAGGGLSSRCRNGTTRQSGPGAAEDDHGHGTNVTGIITGRGTIAPRGVAPDAQIEAFKIIDSNNMLAFSDLNAALDHILAQHPEVDLINMSLGSFSPFAPGTCEFGAAVYNTLRANAVLSLAASMNSGSKTGMGFPACVGSVISVGAVYDANLGSFSTSVCTDSSATVDRVACWSNSDSSLDLLGPGCITTSTGRFGGISSFCGTSQATPHAVGVASLLLQGNPSLTPGQLESTMESTGRSISDPANGIIKPRLDALAAFSVLDADGDGLPNVKDPDDDNDGAWDSIELHAGTGPLVFCSANETPDNEDPDARLADLNDSRTVTGTDLSAIAEVIGKLVPPAPVRRDIAPDPAGDNAVTAADLELVARVIGSQC